MGDARQTKAKATAAAGTAFILTGLEPTGLVAAGVLAAPVYDHIDTIAAVALVYVTLDEAAPGMERGAEAALEDVTLVVR